MLNVSNKHIKLLYKTIINTQMSTITIILVLYVLRLCGEELALCYYPKTFSCYYYLLSENKASHIGKHLFRCVMVPSTGRRWLHLRRWPYLPDTSHPAWQHRRTSAPGTAVYLFIIIQYSCTLKQSCGNVEMREVFLVFKKNSTCDAICNLTIGIAKLFL